MVGGGGSVDGRCGGPGRAFVTFSQQCTSSRPSQKTVPGSHMTEWARLEHSDSSISSSPCRTSHRRQVDSRVQSGAHHRAAMQRVCCRPLDIPHNIAALPWGALPAPMLARERHRSGAEIVGLPSAHPDGGAISPSTDPSSPPCRGRQHGEVGVHPESLLPAPGYSTQRSECSPIACCQPELTLQDARRTGEDASAIGGHHLSIPIAAMPKTAARRGGDSMDTS